jgi:hypothetical protein
VTGREALQHAVDHARQAAELLDTYPPETLNANAHAAVSRAWSAIATEMVYVEIQHPEQVPS